MSDGKRAREAKRIADLIQEAVEKGATTVEDVHRSIADLPLKVLEGVEFLKRPVKEVRRIQDRSIGAVYDLIRSINQQVGARASELLGERGAPKEARSAKAHKPRPKAGRRAKA